MDIIAYPEFAHRLKRKTKGEKVKSKRIQTLRNIHQNAPNMFPNKGNWYLLIKEIVHSTIKIG